MFKRKEEWTFDEDGWTADLVVDRTTDEGPLIKINQDNDTIWLSPEGVRQLIGAVADALAILDNPAPTKRTT